MDMRNYLNFFRSNNGGAWENGEIASKIGWTSKSLKEYIYLRKQLGADYFLIVFVGHGYAVKDSDTYFELTENDNLSLLTLQNWLGLTKSLIIADSCRKFIEIIEKAQTSVTLRTFSSRINSNRQLCRRHYDVKIDALEPFHMTFVASTSLDECAEDTNEGGLFSKSLLEVADTVITSGISGSHEIRKIFDIAVERVKADSKGMQNPELYSTSRSITPPFVIIP